MVAFVSIVVAITMLIVTVYGLHKFQNYEVGANAERSMPLPPLNDATVDKPVLPFSLEREDKQEDGHETEAAMSWMDEVAFLKNEGDFAGAMAVCCQEFPLWSAYNQACIVLRAKLRSLPDDDPQFEPSLRELYNTAVIAEMLHEKSTTSSHLPLSKLKRLDLREFDGLNIDYSALGYANLRLIRKSDVKFMVAHWGRPTQHVLPRSLHHDWWIDFSRRV